MKSTTQVTLGNAANSNNLPLLSESKFNPASLSAFPQLPSNSSNNNNNKNNEGAGHHTSETATMINNNNTIHGNGMTFAAALTAGLTTSQTGNFTRLRGTASPSSLSAMLNNINNNNNNINVNTANASESVVAREWDQSPASGAFHTQSMDWTGLKRANESTTNENANESDDDNTNEIDSSVTTTATTTTTNINSKKKKKNNDIISISNSSNNTNNNDAKQNNNTSQSK